MKAAWGAGETKCTPARLARRKGWMRACGGGTVRGLECPGQEQTVLGQGRPMPHPCPPLPSPSPLIFLFPRENRSHQKSTSIYRYTYLYLCQYVLPCLLLLLFAF